jgi:hypothetical protein
MRSAKIVTVLSVSGLDMATGACSMDQTITIHISESLHRQLMEQGARLGKSVEQLAQDALRERFGSEPRARTPAPKEDPMLAVLRAQGLLTHVSPLVPPSADLAPGSAEEAAILDALGAEASEALSQAGRTLADVVER